MEPISLYEISSYTIAKKQVRIEYVNLNEHKWVSYDERWSWLWSGWNETGVWNRWQPFRKAQKMIVISDSTILIGLVKIGKLDLLKEIFSKVYISEEVFKEVVERGKGKPSIKD